MTTATRIYERRWKMLAVLSLSMMIIGLDNTIVNVALPTLQRQFTASASDLQWIVDAYLLVFAAALLTMGTLGDRYGRKRALQGGLILFGGASAAVIFAGSVNQLIVLRVLMGLGAALIMPATLSIITNVFPREERGRAIGVWAGTAAIGIGLGPLAGGLLLEVFSWSSVFLINVPVAIVALLLGIKLVPDSRDPAPGAFDLIGAALSATALLALVWSVIEAPSRGWTSTAVIAGLVAAALLTAGFIAWERRVASPMLNLAYFRNPRFSIGSLAISIIFFSLMAAIFALTQFLQFALGYSALQAGATMVPLALGLMLSATNSSRLVARFGTKRVVAGGMLLLALTLSATVLWTPALSVWLVTSWLFVLGLAMGSVMAPATDSVMGSVPAGQGRRRLRDERRDPAGRRSLGRGDRRLAHRHHLHQQDRRRDGRPAGGAARTRRGVHRRRQRSRGAPARARGRSPRLGRGGCVHDGAGVRPAGRRGRRAHRRGHRRLAAPGTPRHGDRGRGAAGIAGDSGGSGGMTTRSTSYRRRRSREGWTARHRPARRRGRGAT